MKIFVILKNDSMIAFHDQLSLGVLDMPLCSVSKLPCSHDFPANKGAHGKNSQIVLYTWWNTLFFVGCKFYPID